MSKGSSLLAMFGRGGAKGRAEAPAEDEDPKAEEEDARDPKAEGDDDEDPKATGKTGKRAVDPDEDPDDDDAAAADDDDDEGDEDDEDDEGAPSASGAKARGNFAKGRRAGRRAERARWASVMSDPQTKGREQAAAMLLASGGAPANAVVSAIASMPKAGGALGAAMAGEASTHLGAPPSSAPGTRSLADAMRARVASRQKPGV